jgi:hypothetical protein
MEAMTSLPPCTRMPDWWETGDGGNRLALMVCGRCPFRRGTECTAGQPDPQPHGVIRAGVAYSDAGTVLAICPCGYPKPNSTGGIAPKRCSRCGPPQIAWTYIPPPRAPRPRRQVRPHGTTAALRRHKYHGEDACDACVEAERERDRLRKRTARAALKAVA